MCFSDSSQQPFGMICLNITFYFLYCLLSFAYKSQLVVMDCLSPLAIRTEAKLSLSTAAPSIGGSEPELETRKLTLMHVDDYRKGKVT